VSDTVKVRPVCTHLNTTTKPTTTTTTTTITTPTKSFLRPRSLAFARHTHLPFGRLRFRFGYRFVARQCVLSAQFVVRALSAVRYSAFWIEAVLLCKAPVISCKVASFYTRFSNNNKFLDYANTTSFLDTPHESTQASQHIQTEHSR
jgi:hypothetical protein